MDFSCQPQQVALFPFFIVIPAKRVSNKFLKMYPFHNILFFPLSNLLKEKLHSSSITCGYYIATACKHFIVSHSSYFLKISQFIIFPKISL